jgi:hypothetical protein
MTTRILAGLPLAAALIFVMIAAPGRLPTGRVVMVEIVGAIGLLVVVWMQAGSHASSVTTAEEYDIAGTIDRRWFK